MTSPTWNFSCQLTWEQVSTIKARIDRQPVPALWRLMEINQHNTGEWTVSLFRTQSPMRVEKITEWAYWQQFRVNELEPVSPDGAATTSVETSGNAFWREETR